MEWNLSIRDMVMAIFRLFEKKTSISNSGILSSSVDRHTHILPGVDDGIRKIKESLTVLEYLENQGVSVVWCTPHIMEDIPNTTDELKHKFDELKQAYNGPIRLKLAAEYMIDTLLTERLKDDDLLTMEDNMILVETSMHTPPYNMKDILSDMLSMGYFPLLAHVERYTYLRKKDYFELKNMGVRLQLNFGSLVGFYGNTVKSKALSLLEHGMYYCSGSDCHGFKRMIEEYNIRDLSQKTVLQLKEIVQ